MHSWQILLTLLAALQSELVYAVSSIAGLYSDILNYDEPAIYHPIQTIHADYDHSSLQPILGYRDALPDSRTLGHTKHKIMVVKDLAVDSHHDDVHHLFPAPPSHYISPQHSYSPYHDEPHWMKIKRIEFINEHDGHGFRKLIEYDFSRAAAEMMQQHWGIAKRETNNKRKLLAKQNISNVKSTRNQVGNDRNKRALYSPYLPIRPLYTATYIPKTNYFKKPAYIYPPNFIPPISYYPSPLNYQKLKNYNPLLYPNLYNPNLLKRYKRDTLPQKHEVSKRFTLLHFPHSHHKTVSTFHSIHHPALLYHRLRDDRARKNSGEPIKARNNPEVVEGTHMTPSHLAPHSHPAVPLHLHGAPSEPMKPQNRPSYPGSSPSSYHMTPTNQKLQNHFPVLVQKPADHISYPDHSQHPTGHSQYLTTGHGEPAEFPHHPVPVQHTQYPPHTHIWPQVYYPQQSPSMK